MRLAQIFDNLGKAFRRPLFRVKLGGRLYDRIGKICTESSADQSVHHPQLGPGIRCDLQRWNWTFGQAELPQPVNLVFNRMHFASVGFSWGNQRKNIVSKPIPETLQPDAETCSAQQSEPRS